MIEFKKVILPEKEADIFPITLPDETIIKRKRNVLEKMESMGLDTLIVYADLEHGGNFEYLIGFLPRFEEALLVLHADGDAFLVLGNENFNKAEKARISASAICLSHFSLPDQPMQIEESVSQILGRVCIKDKKTIGLAGWKKFTSSVEENGKMFDLPNYLIEALRKAAPYAEFVNAIDLFIGEDGIRRTNDADEFAHYEFGAALAGNCILETMAAIQEGMTEMEAASYLSVGGQRHSVVTIMASGPRFVKANMYPSCNKIKRGDPISITTGFRGGLQSRSGYAISAVEELPEGYEDYLEKVAIPYFRAVVTWLEKIRIGMTGKNLYDLIEEVLPKEKYNWRLNPGHLCAEEEWLCSPVYPESQEELKSGMLFQIDIIPSVPGYAGISCESGIMLADENLRQEIQKKYPAVWKRILKRQKYIKEVLGIRISEEIIPTSAATAFCRPFLLNKECALVQKNM